MNKCFGCLAEFSTFSDERHPYIGASGACWEMYGHILAKEFGDPAYFKVHRTTVDAYGAQHIGDQSDRRARQSAWVHLIALYLSFEKKMPKAQVVDFLKKATATKKDWPPQVQIQAPQWLTVHDVTNADSPESHALLVTQWGQSVWDAYGDYHDQVVKIYSGV